MFLLFLYKISVFFDNYNDILICPVHKTSGIKQSTNVNYFMPVSKFSNSLFLLLSVSKEFLNGFIHA